ncbi:MAG: calcium/sodium antiporter [Spirochaetales bacterium]|nr:calcium/sodium antiporter [Spirochaetales bacterium]
MHFVSENIFASLAALAVAFYTLTKSADLLVDGAVGVARRLRVPKMIIGIVLVGLGTTAPEFSVSMISAIKGNANIALGNAVGSVIADDALALALGIIVAPQALRVDSRILRSAGIFLICIDVLSFILALNGVISHYEGFILLGLLVVYFAFVIITEKKNRDKKNEDEYEQDIEDHSHSGSNLFSQLANPLFGIAAVIILSLVNAPPAVSTGALFVYMLYLVFYARIEKNRKRKSLISPAVKAKGSFQLIMLAAGIGLIIISGELLVEAAVNIAVFLHISDVIIGLTIVAIGTSLPEIATCIIASRKGHGDLALGDIIGADILNMLWIMGGAAAVSEIRVDRNEVLFMFPAMITVVLTMLVFARMRYRLERWKGFVLLGMYIVYLVLTFVMTGKN